MNYNEDKERAELLERFTNDLPKSFSERYYSEEDLLEVFDTAGDMNNDYVQLEALMLGARLYPDSVALTERRAIFLLGFESDAFESFMALHQGLDTPIMELYTTMRMLGGMMGPRMAPDAMTAPARPLS